MDTGSKTLAQLAQEHNEKKFVTLDIASKISGYKREYLERLCLSGKIEYRLWNNDQVVPELDSLLSVTHTILVSYDGIDLVNKEETREVKASESSDVSGNIVNPFTPNNTPLGGADQALRKERLKYVGTPVVSDPRSEHIADDDRVVSIAQVSSVGKEDVPSVVPTYNAEPVHRSIPISGESDEELSVQAQAEPTVKHIPVMQDVAEDLSIEPEPQHDLPHAPVHVPIVASDDELTTELFGSTAPIAPMKTVEQQEEQKSVVASNTTPAPLAASIPASSPTGAVHSDMMIYDAHLPAIPQDRHMITVDKNPLSTSIAFQTLFTLSLIALAALVGYFNFQSSQSQFATQDDQSMSDALAGVAASFSDNVIVKEGEGNSIIVEPIFKERSGQAREFIVIPLGK